MAQFKIYGRAEFLRSNTGVISDVIQGAAVEVLGLPESKRFHRSTAGPGSTRRISR